MRLLGTVAHCHACAEAFLAPIRARQPVIRIHRPIIGEPAGNDHPAGMRWLRCTQCNADWVGYPEDDCSWCNDKDARMREDERNALLYPPWATNANGARYDALSDEDKKVWRQTRGQTTDADSALRWLHALTAAVTQGEITEAQAREAIDRVLDA